MDTIQLRYFLIAAESKSFRKAAEKAFVSQQALSKSIINIETELKVPLFTRTKTGIEVTSYGRIFKERAKHMLSYYDETRNMLLSEDNDKKCILFGFPFGMLELGLLDYINKFEKANPDIELILYETSDTDIENGVYEGKFDMGLLSGISNDIEFDCIILKRYKSYLSLNRSHLFSSKKTIRLEDLRYESFLTSPENYNVHKALVAACVSAGFQPNFCAFSIDYHKIKEFIIKGKGIFITAENLRNQIEDDNIVFIEIEDDPFVFSPNLIAQKGAAQSTAAKKQFWNYFRSADFNI